MGSLPKLNIPKTQTIKLPTVHLPTFEDVTGLDVNVPTIKDIEVAGGKAIEDTAAEISTVAENIHDVGSKAIEDTKAELSRAGENIKTEAGVLGENIKNALGIGGGRGGSGGGSIVPPKEVDIPTEDEVEEEAKKAREFENIKRSGLMGRQSTIKNGKGRGRALLSATETLLGR